MQSGLSYLHCRVIFVTLDDASDSDDSLEDAIHSFTADVAVSPATYEAAASANLNDNDLGPLEEFVMNCENVCR